MTQEQRNLQYLTSTRAAGRSEAVPEPRSRWKTRVLLPGGILLSVIGLLIFTAAQSLLPATPVQVIPVVVKSVQGGGGGGRVTVQAPGWLEPDPFPYFVAGLADGVVNECLVLEGESVEAGQVVARLVSDDARLALDRAEAELRMREAGVDASIAELEAAQLRFDTLVESTRAVALSVASLTEAIAEIEKARADLAVEDAKLAELDDEYQRKSKLVDSQAVSEAVVARLGLRINAQSATVEAAKARLTVLEAKRARAEAELEAAQRNHELLIDERRALALARSSLADAEAAVALARATRDESALRLDRMDVRSPVAGVVLRRLVSPGSRLMQNGVEHASHAVHLYDPAKLQVRVDVPLADAAQVSIGQTAEIIVEVLPDRVFKGRVTRIVHEADIQKNTVEVKVAVADPISDLKPEMLARVRFIATDGPGGGGGRERVFAPSELIRDTAGGPSALVVTDLSDGRGRVSRRSITLGSRTIDKWTEIESGLQPGDLLIASPGPDLAAGDRVRVTGEADYGNGE